MTRELYHMMSSLDRNVTKISTGTANDLHNRCTTEFCLLNILGMHDA